MRQYRSHNGVSDGAGMLLNLTRKRKYCDELLAYQKDISEPVTDEQISALFDDQDFRTISRRMSEFNLFEAVGAVNGELRHSNFLAYLLSPGRPHGLGPEPLRRFLRLALDRGNASAGIGRIELMVADLADALVHRERDNMDLIIEIDELKLVVLVENKIHAKAGRGQLKRYREILEAQYPDHRRILIFLTPAGHEPDDPAYQSVSYSSLADELDIVADDIPAGQPIGLIMRQYVDMLRKNIVEDTKLRALAAKLYERHSPALDFIFQSRPRPAGLIDHVAEMVRVRQDLSVYADTMTALRFAPDVWSDLSFETDREHRWSNGSCGILFEVKAPKPGRVSISLIIGPGDQNYRSAMYEAVKSRPDLFVRQAKTMGATYSTLYSCDLLVITDASHKTAEQKKQDLERAWTNFSDIVLPKLTEAVIELDRQITGAELTV